MISGQEDDIVNRLAGQIKNAHAAKFDPDVRDVRRGGVELELPLVYGSGERFGTAISAEDTIRLLSEVSMATGWMPEQGGIALKKRINGYSSEIAMEAGVSTLEFSFPPVTDIEKTRQMVSELTVPLLDAAHDLGIIVMGYGVQPITKPFPELFSPLDKYQAKLVNRDAFYRRQPDNMDISTTISAAQHIQVEAMGSEEAIRLLNVLNGISPELIALTANSRIMGRADSGHADPRSMFYENYGKIEVAGVAPRFASFDEYYAKLLTVPLTLLKRDGKYFVVAERITLGDYISKGTVQVKKFGEDEAFAMHFSPSDIDTVEGTVRWEARVKGATGTVELRSLSTQRSGSEALALYSAVVGIAANLDKAEAFALRRDVEQTRAAKRNASRYGISGAGEQMLRSARELLDIAQEGLERLGENTEYLKILYDRLYSRRAPSDNGAEVFNQQGVRPFIESRRFNPDE